MRPYRMLTVCLVLTFVGVASAQYLTRWLGEWAAWVGICLCAYGALWYGGSRWS